MSIAKIDFKIGEISFIGEGEAEWLEKQLDKLLDKAEELLKISSELNKDAKVQDNKPADFTGNTEIASQPLATFLQSKNATSVQVLKFLATSVWLEAKGKDRLKTSDVTAALSDNKQTRLGNPADCLNQNISKGYCEKKGADFFVTQEGKKSLGL